jgi:hypothetical protein
MGLATPGKKRKKSGREKKRNDRRKMCIASARLITQSFFFHMLINCYILGTSVWIKLGRTLYYR